MLNEAIANTLQLLYASGFLFQGATEQQMALIDGSSMDVISYILITYSLAFLMFLFANMLIHLHDRLSNPPLDTKGFTSGTHLNGRAVEDGQIRAAEEFELDGLSTDDEDDERQGMLAGEGGSFPKRPVAAQS
jgi:hypothetical protein